MRSLISIANNQIMLPLNHTHVNRNLAVVPPLLPQSVSRAQLQLKELLRNRIYDRGMTAGKLPNLGRSKSQRTLSHGGKLASIPRDHSVLRGVANVGHTESASMLATLREANPETNQYGSSGHHRGKSSSYNVYNTANQTQTARQWRDEEGKSRHKSSITSTLVRSITGYTVSGCYI